MVKTYTPLVGQYSKQQGLAAFRRAFLWAMICMVVFSLVGGVIIGLAVRPWVGQWLGGPVVSSLVLFGAVVVSLVALAMVMRYLDKIMEKAAKRRLSLLLGGQAEVYVHWRLRDGLEGDWHLFDNLKLDDRSDIDHVLVGPTGLYVVSTKSQKGRYIVADASHGGRPTFNGEPSDWAADATRQAMRLRDQLAVVEPSERPWVQVVLALPFARVERGEANGTKGPATVDKAWVLNEEDLIDTIEPVGGKRKLNKHEIERWAAAVEKLHTRHVSVVNAS